MFSLEFILSGILTILLVVLDKLGKLTLPVLIGLFLLAALLAVHPALVNPWVGAAPTAAWKLWRAGTCLSIVLILFSGMGIWIFSGQLPISRFSNKATDRSHVIQQRGRANIAQIGNNNNAVVSIGQKQRRLSTAQKDKLIALLSQHRDVPFVGVYALLYDGEGNIYAQDFFSVFKTARWDVKKMVGKYTNFPSPDPDNPVPQGVWILINPEDVKEPPPAVGILQEIFASVDINPNVWILNLIPAGKIAIFIGAAESSNPAD